MEFALLLKQVPAVVWSALLASALTLTGVMLSNRSNTKRLMLQLEHDANQKAKDRMAALHREVYLKLAEEMARASSFLGKISQIDPSKENIADGFAELFAVGAKAQLIAQPETSRLITELTTRYGEMVMRLLAKASTAHNFNIDIRLANEQIEKNHKEANRAIAEIRQIAESGRHEPIRIKALQSTIDHSMEMANQLSDKRDTFWSGHFSASRAFNTALLEEMRLVGPVQTQAMAALRGELGLRSDAAEYQKRVDETWQRMDAELERAMDRIAAG